MKFYKFHTLPILVLTVIALVSVKGILSGFSTSLYYGGDDALITWILNQTIQKIPHDLDNIFHGNIFYPNRYTLAYSTMMIPSALLAFIPTKLTGSPITAYNFTIVVSQVLTTLLIYLIFYEITKDKLVSVVTSLVFVLSPLRMGFSVHIHMFTMQYFLTSLYFFIRFKTKKDIRYLYLGFLFMGIQVWEHLIQPVWLMFIATPILLSEIRTIKNNKWHLIFSALLGLLIALPPMRAYYLVSDQFEYSRSIRDAAHFAMSADKIGVGLIGVGIFVLGGISLLLVKKTDVKKVFFLKLMLYLSLLGLLMPLGPVLKWQGETLKILNRFYVPLPYGVFYYLIPPLRALRSVERWIWLFGFGLTGASAIVLSRYGGKFKNMILLGLLTIVVATATHVGKNQYYIGKEHEYPAVYRWLKEQDANVIWEYPLYTWGDAEHGIEMVRMFYSLYHGKSSIYGASGFLPENREKNMGVLGREFPSEHSTDILKRYGAYYVIVHKDKINSNDLERIKNFYKEDVIYENSHSVVLGV